MKKIKQLAQGAAALLCSASLCLGSSAVAGHHNGKASFSKDQVKEVQKIVHDYLLNNPEILQETADALRAKQQMETKRIQETAISKNHQQIFDDANSPSVGAAKPSVYLVEFFDYQCGHCKYLQKAVDKLLKNNSGLKVILKEFPIFGESSEVAARVALAANKQGKYWAVHEALMAAQNPMTEVKALAAAKTSGCNMRRLKKDMNSPSIKAMLLANGKLANALRLQGTPALIFANASQANPILIPGGMPEMAMQGLVNKQKDSNQ